MVVVMMGMVVGAVESAMPVAAAVEVARQMVVYRLPLNGTLRACDQCRRLAGLMKRSRNACSVDLTG